MSSTNLLKQMPGEDLLLSLDTGLDDVLSRLRKGRIISVGCPVPRQVATDFWRSPRGGRSLHFYQGVPYRYLRDEGRFRAQSEGDFHTEVLTFIERVYEDQARSFRDCFVPEFHRQIRARGVRSSFVTDVIDSLKGMVNVPGETQLPTWVDDFHQRGRSLSMANGIIDLDALTKNGETKVQDHTPTFFTLSSLPFRYEPRATCPRWEAFLNEVLEGDQQRIALLQEWFGYCLLPTTHLQKFLLLEGMGANGKSVTVDVLTGMLGGENISSVPLEVFTERFALAATHGKLLNVCSEATALSARAEGLVKQYVAGDLLTADRKFVEPLQFRPTAKLLITTNNRPKVSDESDGFWRRMLVIPFKVQIPEERQDRHLAEKLLRDEAPGIFNWAVEGLRRLQAKERFTASDVASAAVAEYREEDNPVRAFVTERLELIPDGELTVDGAWRTYERWCYDSGETPMPLKPFGRSLRRACPNIERVRARVGEGRSYVYRGVRIRREAVLHPVVQ